MNEIILEFINTLDLNDYQAIGLIGSYSSGKETRWSDVDLLFVTQESRENQTRIFKDKYFTLSFYKEEDFDAYLRSSELILKIPSFLDMKIIYDKEEILKNVQERFKAFKLTNVHKEHALFNAKKLYMSYLEEAQKGLQGLIENHTGKMLCGLYGLSYGMFQVIALRDSIMIKSDNDFYEAVMAATDKKDLLHDLAPHVFGLDQTTLHDQVEAGLELFIHVGNTLIDLFTEEEKMYAIKLMQEIIKEI